MSNLEIIEFMHGRLQFTELDEEPKFCLLRASSSSHSPGWEEGHVAKGRKGVGCLSRNFSNSTIS
jgi:hypothetical protein